MDMAKKQKFKKCNISLNYLFDLQKVLKTINTDEAKEDAKRLDFFIAKLANNFYPSDSDHNLFEQLDFDIINLEYFKKYYPYIRKFYNTGTNFFDVVSDNYMEFVLSDRDVIELGEYFFHEKGPFFFDKYKSFINERDKRIKFFTPNNYTDGETFFLNSIKEGFVLSPNYIDITKFLIFIHEAEHMIDFLNNNIFMNNLLIRETSALFMEMVACDFIASDLYMEEDAITRKMNIHSLIKEDNTHLFYKTQFLTLAKKFDTTNDQLLLNTLQKYGYDEESFKLFERDSLVNDYYYQISYLTAIELYNIYKNDQEYALFILKELITKANDDNILQFLEHFEICLGESLSGYEDSLLTK